MHTGVRNDSLLQRREEQEIRENMSALEDELIFLRNAKVRAIVCLKLGKLTFLIG